MRLLSFRSCCRLAQAFPAMRHNTRVNIIRSQWVSVFSRIGKRGLYNVSGPRYYTPCTVCSEHHLWSPERDGQFYCDRVYEEELGSYRSGGHHPVHLGDTLADGRYTVVQKMKWGRDAIIWLATDRESSRYVAIKISQSHRRQDEGEAQSLKTLTEGSTNHPGKRHVVQLLDRFEMKGPNGRHLCIVLEALGPSIEPNDLSPYGAWKVAKQLVEGVAYSHHLGVAHGDIRQERVLFSSLTLLQSSAQTQPKPKIGNIRNVDEEGNVVSLLSQTSTARVPRYLVQSLQKDLRSPLQNLGDNPQVKIIGFGERFLAGKTSGSKFPFRFQAPELLLFSQLGPKADIWSLGCLIYKLVSGGDLFCPLWDTKKDMIEEWACNIGDLPEEWRKYCPPGFMADAEPNGSTPQVTIRDEIDHTASVCRPGTYWYSKASRDTLAELLGSMMQYRPSDRPSAAALLDHPWFERLPSLSPCPMK